MVRKGELVCLLEYYRESRVSRYIIVGKYGGMEGLVKDADNVVKGERQCLPSKLKHIPPYSE